MHLSFERAEEIARACLPDLAGVELRIVESDLGAMAGCYAAANQVEGAVTVHVRAGMYDHEPSFCGLVLHELCHWLNAPPTPQPTAKQFDFTAGVAAVSAQHAADLATPARLPSAYWQHSDEFIRAACHIVWRCNNVAGAFMLPEWLVFGSAYSTLGAMNPPDLYVAMLHDECEAMAGKPLREVLATVPPAAFKGLCHFDFRSLVNAAIAARAA